MTVTEALVDWAWALQPGRIPAPVQAAACRHLLDGVGTAIAAARGHAADFAPAVARELGGPEEATILGTNDRVSAPAAALANGALVHGLDFDDTHADALVHGTAVVLPAALAVGEQVGATGRDVLTAAVIGYEVALRLGAAVRHGFHVRGFHATSVVGVFSAAIVASRLAGHDQPTAVAALGIAGSQASGSLEFLSSGSSTKQLHPGWASLAGIVAARLAAAGASGPSTIIEGEAGLYRTHADREVEPSAVLEGLGERWELPRSTIKPYPACQLSHATLDAITELADRIDDPGGTVATIEVDLPRDSVAIVAEPVETKRRPRTPYEAKFSLPWNVAALLLDGHLDVASFAPAQLEREDIRALAARVEVRATDPEVAAAAAPGHATVTLRNGSSLVGRVPNSSGGPERPLTEEQLDAKFHANMGGRSARTEALVALIRDLPSQPDLRHLVAALATTTTEEPTG